MTVVSPWTPLMVAMAIVAFAGSVTGQSHAAGATIEGRVVDETGAPVGGAIAVVTNDGTGLRQEAHTSQRGRYQLSLLPPGSYSIRIHRDRFSRYERSGVTLTAGARARIDVTLDAGATDETITVIGSAPLTRPASIDSGALLTRAEMNRLPSPQRNSLNFVQLLPGVAGIETDELLTPRLVANGAQMRTSFLLDGNSITQRDRAGVRLVTLSPIMIDEMPVTTGGFSPEFGQATGLVINAVTPSGTNQFAGSARVDFWTPGMSARPALARPAEPVPLSRSLDVAATAGGPLVRDRLHYFAGYERIDRDSGSIPITIAPQAAQRLGLTLPPDGRVDVLQTEHYYIGKINYQASSRHHFSGRLLGFHNDSPSFGSGGLVAAERMVDIFVRTSSVALQATSTLGPSMQNELRIHRAARWMFRVASPAAADGPAVDINGVASLGGPLFNLQDAGSNFYEESWQVVETLNRGWNGHFLKAGVDVQRGTDRRVNTNRWYYLFPSMDAYLSARAGTNPLGYVNYIEDVGSQSLFMRSTSVAGFVQDDLSIGNRVHVQVGARYDLFVPPSTAGTSAPAFGTDVDNIAPRVGAAWSIDGDALTVVRASLSKLYDTPMLALYQDVLLSHAVGSQTLVLKPPTQGAPEFPLRASTAALSAASGRPAPSIIKMQPDMPTQSAWLFHLQVERLLRSRTVLSASYTHSAGRDLPVLADRNLIPTPARLADGRPIYEPVVSPATRVDPRYDHVDVIEPAGRSRYDALILSLRSEPFTGAQINTSYTLSRALDSSPLTNVYVQGSRDDRLSDPSNVQRDYGRSPFDQRHTFSLMGSSASLYVPGFAVGVIVQLTSGMPANIRSKLDLNLDGRPNDRPLWLGRNSGETGQIAMVDVKISQQLWRSRRARAHAFVSVKNLFNTENPWMVNRFVDTTDAGELIGPVTQPLPPTQAFSPRRAQVGVSLDF